MTYKVSRCVRCPCGRDNGVEQPALTGRLIGPGQESALQQLQPSGRHQRLCGDHRAVSGADREQRLSGVEAVVALRPPQLGLGRTPPFVVVSAAVSVRRRSARWF